jgi:hypothetical protein
MPSTILRLIVAFFVAALRLQAQTMTSNPASLICARLKDSTVLRQGPQGLQMTERLLAAPLFVTESNRRSSSNIAGFFFRPLVAIENGKERVMFAGQNPTIRSSSGRVRSIAFFVRGEGFKPVPGQYDTQGVYYLEIEFSSDVPPQFEVTLSFQDKVATLKESTAIIFIANSDGLPIEDSAKIHTDYTLRIEKCGRYDQRLIDENTGAALIANGVEFSLQANHRYRIGIK